MVVMAAGAATAGLDKHLEVFEPYIGQTLEGAFVLGLLFLLPLPQSFHE